MDCMSSSTESPSVSVPVTPSPAPSEEPTAMPSALPAPRDAARDKRKHTGTQPTTRKKTHGLPVYERRPWSTTHHGRAHSDDFRWLRDKRDPKVQRLLHAENDLVSRFFHGAAPGLQRTLCKEMRSRAKLDDASLPTRDRNFWYYTRQVKNEEYALHCRRPCDLKHNINANFVEEVSELWQRDPRAPLPFYDDEQIILDPNLLQRELGLDFIEIGDMDVSPDEAHLAVTLDCSGGREIFTVFVLEIKDVNYRRWLDVDAGDVYRAWVRDMERKEESIYGSPTSSVSTLSGASSPATLTGTGTGGSRSRKGTAPRARSRPSPAIDATTPQSKGSLRFPSKPCSPVYSGPRTPPPAHRQLHRLDMFDLSSEVLWVNAHCLLYVAVDDKMRPFQLVHHDLNVADDDPAASVICFEEDDEEFWVGAVGFTVDEAFLTFSSASTEVSEWYVCPHDAAINTATDPHHRCRNLSGAPVVRRAMAESDAVGLDSVWQDAQSCGRALAPTYCFARRVDAAVGREYELDHHATLLADSGTGAWLINSNTRGLKDFSLFVLPDDETELGTHQALSLSETREVACEERWRQLVAVPANVKVEGVEVYRDYLLISVRRHGTPTVLFLPVATVRAWWATESGCERHAQRPLPLTALVDLSQMLQQLQPVLSSAAPQQQQPTAQSVGGTVTRTVRELLASQASSSSSWCPPRAPDGVAGAPHWQPLPLIVEAYGASTSFSCDRFRLHAGHLVHPTVVYEVVMSHDTNSHSDSDTANTDASLTVRRLRVEVVYGNYDAAAYTGAVVWVPSAYSFTHKAVPDADRIPTEHASPDVSVPVLLCWKTTGSDPLTGTGDVPANDGLDQRPLLLNVYGSYGDCSDPDFSSERLSLLDRGFVWAYAGVRGGGELGIAWRDAGRKLQRATTINDVISVSSYLQDSGYCAPGRLCLAGGSAGGLVVMRAALQAPQLFHTVVAAVPFVDCLNTLLDDTLPLTVTEWSECGNPVDDPLAYDLLETLTPVEVVAHWAAASSPSSFPPRTGVRLPHVLLESALDDSRVGYWEPLKMMAYLRTLLPLHPMLLSTSTTSTAEKSPLPVEENASLMLHYCDFQNGHAGANGRFQQWEETAREYAFIIACQYI